MRRPIVLVLFAIANGIPLKVKGAPDKQNSSGYGISIPGITSFNFWISESISGLIRNTLHEQKFVFVMPVRFLQDCVENLFSTLRSGNPKCNALQVRDAVKSVAISEYLSPPLRKTSYNWDDSQFFVGFFENC